MKELEQDGEEQKMIDSIAFGIRGSLTSGHLLDDADDDRESDSTTTTRSDSDSDYEE
jgi:hypothetical protein